MLTVEVDKVARARRRKLKLKLSRPGKVGASHNNRLLLLAVGSNTALTWMIAI